MQYLFSPPREGSDSEHEEEECDGEGAATTDVPVGENIASRKRRKEDRDQFKGAESSVFVFCIYMFISSW